MESFMPTTSWQTSLSAEYYTGVSTPNSPGSPVASPASPTLYQQNATNGGLYPGAGDASDLGLSKGGASNRSQMAATLLKSLDEYQNLEQLQAQNNDSGFDWNDENVNLELFNELSALEYTAPTPAPQEFDNQLQLTGYEEAEPAQQTDVELLDYLSAEFQEILESLPRTARADNLGEELIDITDLIFSSPAETRALQLQTDHAAAVQLALAGLAGESQTTGNTSASDASTDESENDDDIFMELDVTTAAAELGASYQYLNPEETMSSMVSYHSGSSLSGTEDEDQNMMSDERMLDALLGGKLEEAVTFMPGAISPMNYMSTSTLALNSAVEKKSKETTRKPAKKATTQRRKKAPKIEKAIRKKEQNKTAALRYRMKKKLEVECTLEQETELQVEHDKLVKQKDELHKEVLMVKQLLRAVFSDRKKKMQGMRKF